MTLLPMSEPINSSCVFFEKYSANMRFFMPLFPAITPFDDLSPYVLISDQTIQNFFEHMVKRALTLYKQALIFDIILLQDNPNLIESKYWRLKKIELFTQEIACVNVYFSKNIQNRQKMYLKSSYVIDNGYYCLDILSIIQPNVRITSDYLGTKLPRCSPQHIHLPLEFILNIFNQYPINDIPAIFIEGCKTYPELREYVLFYFVTQGRDEEVAQLLKQWNWVEIQTILQKKFLFRNNRGEIYHCNAYVSAHLLENNNLCMRLMGHMDVNIRNRMASAIHELMPMKKNLRLESSVAFTLSTNADVQLLSYYGFNENQIARLIGNKNNLRFIFILVKCYAMIIPHKQYETPSQNGFNRNLIVDLFLSEDGPHKMMHLSQNLHDFLAVKLYHQEVYLVYIQRAIPYISNILINIRIAQQFGVLNDKIGELFQTNPSLFVHKIFNFDIIQELKLINHDIEPIIPSEGAFSAFSMRKENEQMLSKDSKRPIDSVISPSDLKANKVKKVQIEKKASSVLLPYVPINHSSVEPRRTSYDLNNSIHVEAFKKRCHELSPPVEFVHSGRMDLIKNLSIVEIPVLGQETQRILGVIVREPFAIKKNTTLAEYIGALIPDEDVKSDTDLAYLMQSPQDGYVINAERLRTAVAFLNTVPSGGQANALMVKEGKKNQVCCEILGPSDPIGKDTARFYPSGTQLLIEYGPGYDDKHSFNQFCFINPMHSSEDSLGIYHTYTELGFYRQAVEKLPEVFLSYFNSDKRIDYLRPQHEVEGFAYFDPPMLEVLESTPIYLFVSQAGSENITELMLACFLGDIPLVQRLLEAGNNPNRQSTLSGINAFHIVARAPISLEDKKKLMTLLFSKRENIVPFDEAKIRQYPVDKELIIQNTSLGLPEFRWRTEGHLLLQDKNHYSALHHAIAENNPDTADMVQYLLEKEPEFWNLEKIGLDPILFAISAKNSVVVDRLVMMLSNMKPKYVRLHLKHLIEENTDHAISRFEQTFLTMESIDNTEKITLLDRFLISCLLYIDSNQAGFKTLESIYVSLREKLAIVDSHSRSRHEKVLSPNELYDRSVDLSTIADDQYNQSEDQHNLTLINHVLEQKWDAYRLAIKAREKFLQQKKGTSVKETNQELIQPIISTIQFLEDLKQAILLLQSAIDLLTQRLQDKALDKAETANKIYQRLLSRDPGDSMLTYHVNNCKELIQNIQKSSLDQNLPHTKMHALMGLSLFGPSVGHPQPSNASPDEKRVSTRA